MNGIQILTILWVFWLALAINLWRWSRNWYDKTGFYAPTLILLLLLILMSCGPNIESKKQMVLLSEPKKEFVTFEKFNFIIYSWDSQNFYQETLGTGPENLEKEKSKKFYQTWGVSFFGIPDNAKKIERF